MIVAVDPGKTSGVALVDGARLVYAGKVVSEDVDPYPKVRELRKALELAGGEQRLYFVTEAQYIGNTKAIASTIQVVRNAATWAVCARLLKIGDLGTVWPASWQALFGLSGGGADRAMVDKLRWNLVARRFGTVLGRTGRDPNVQSALLIGLYQSLKMGGWKRGKRLPKNFEWINREVDMVRLERRRLETHGTVSQ